MGGQPETGPEQFSFVIVPGDQAPDEAAATVGGDLSDGTIENALHVGSVSTPFGQTDIYSFTQVNADGEWTCQAISSPDGGSATCGQGEIDAVPAEEVKVSSTGTDGTKYKSNVVAGIALIVYPLHRGRVVAQGFGGGDQPVGKPLIIESLP